MAEIRRATRPEPPGATLLPEPDTVPVPVSDAVISPPSRQAVALGWASLVLGVLATLGLAAGSFLGLLPIPWDSMLALAALPVGAVLGAGSWLRRSRIATGPVRTLGPSLELVSATWSLAQLGARRGLRLSLSVHAYGQAGRSLDVVVRFRSPSGQYYAGKLLKYRGESGEVRLQHRTRPMRHDPAFFADLWVFLPTRALPVSQVLTRFRTTAEVLLAIDGQVHLEVDIPIEFEIAEDDFGLVATGSLPPGASEPPIQIVGTTDGTTEMACGVCGEGLYGPTTRCRVCATPHHSDCWEFFGGCSVYACEGRPRG